MSLLAAKHLNRGLFSDYYLDQVVPTLSEWQSPELHAQAKILRDDLKTLLDKVHPESLDEAQLEEQWVKPAFKTDIPLSERSDWERYLADQTNHHTDATNRIIDLEIRLNSIVYEAFNLSPDEIALIEKSTKYPYGAV